MRMNGRYIINNDIVLPNVVVNEGELSLLKMMWQGDVTDVALGGNFFVGLTNDTGVAADATLANLSGEPGATGGYARQPLTRDATGFPTIDLINGVGRALSASVSFTAAGANFDTAITRLFICNVVSGVGGILYSISQRLVTPKTIMDTETYAVRYEFMTDGS